MNQESVSFIGGGNMTIAIVGGLLESGFSSERISIAEPFEEQRRKLAEMFPGITVYAENGPAVASANTVVLAVKPQIIAGVCRQLSSVAQQHKPFFISIAAGPRIADIDSWLGGGHAVARVMPNQPALLGQGVSGLFANDATSKDQLQTAQDIMTAVGPVVVVNNENDIDAVTAVSGSGPAYFYLLIDMLAKTGAELGLDATSAEQLAIETAVGASQLAKTSGDSMGELIARVRSPGGTTAAALDSLEGNGVRDIFTNALTAARDRAIFLANQAHKDDQE